MRRLWEWFRFWYLPSGRWCVEAWRWRTDEVVAVYHGRTRRRLLNVINSWDRDQVRFIHKKVTSDG
jgi:hypothetical protein